jgi:hypothetical protein
MTALKVIAFQGEVPRTSARLLSEGQAVEALNCKITSGRLDPLRGLLLTNTSLLADTIQSMYRYKFGAQLNWLVWDVSTDVVRSPTAQDALGRLFYTGDGEPRMTTYADAISGGGPYPAGFFVLGVVAPATAPTVAVTGGTGTAETRAYVTTFVTQYAEESAPSPSALGTGNTDGTWTISGLASPPPNSGAATAATANTPGSGFVTVTLNNTYGLAPYEQIEFSGIGGMTDLNGKFTITSITGNDVVVALDTAQTFTSSGTWARVAPHNTTGMKRRIYRSAGTDATYFFVAEIDASTTSYVDAVAGVDLGEVIPAIDTGPPPKNGSSLVVLANGALAMLAANQICFSEQYKPYSWPIGNRYSFASDGVALCAADNSVIILTDQFPLVATATVPEAASLASLDTYAPCVSKRGTVDIGGGCAYPGHDGLYVATPVSINKITERLYRIDEWKAINPTSFKAATYDGCYYAMHTGATGDTDRILKIDVHEPGSVTEVDERVDSLALNPWDGNLYVSKGSKIYQWDADDSNRYLTFWQSREYQLQHELNFSCAIVRAIYDDIVPVNNNTLTANTALLATSYGAAGCLNGAGVNVNAVNGSALQPVSSVTARRLQFSLMRRDQVVFSKSLTSSKPFKMKAGFKDNVYSLQIASSIPVYSVGVAQTIKELEGVS